MRKAGWLIGLLVCSSGIAAQTVQERLATATQRLLTDSQMKHAILGVSVIKTATGEKVFEINPQVGLAPASCQKVITSAAAMELLGPQYRYQTLLGYDGEISKGILTGNIYLSGSGDPSLGSWRYDSTKTDTILKRWVQALQQNGIKSMTGELIGYNGKWETDILPGGWIWDDMGNYYGAGSAALNWHENQYDLVLRSGTAIGSAVSIADMRPWPYNVQLKNEVKAAAKGTGDNAYIYLPPFSQTGFVRGTIPVNEKAFTISGSFPDPAVQLITTLKKKMDSVGIKPKGFSVSSAAKMPVFTILQTYVSPTLDSLNFFFLRRSINLYGEAFIKTIAYEKTGFGSAEKGLELVKQFWKERGIESSAIRMIDGSGLSPQNRVTTDALVKVLQYAKDQSWYRYYYEAFPIYNQMKLKSGTIGGAKGFAGYHTARDGTAYTVVIIVNNYEGSAAQIVSKMFKVLDELK